MIKRKGIKIFLAAFAVFLLAAGVCNAGTKDAHLEFSAGWREDNLNWNIAGTTQGTDPNILSELKWTGIQTAYLKASLNTTIYKEAYLRTHYGYGVIYAGDNRDSDYLGDDRTIEYSRSINDAGKGSVADASAGFGYRLYPFPGSRSFWIGPALGYSYNRQELHITDGFQAIPLEGPFAGLDSSYEAEWTGPWAGIDFLLSLGRFSLSGSFEYHIASYEAVADWNLRDDFEHPDSFDHTADGNGVVATLQGDFALRKHLSISASMGLKDFTTGDGIDRTYFTDGSSIDTRLNEVNWDSLDIMAGIKYVY